MYYKLFRVNTFLKLGGSPSELEQGCKTRNLCDNIFWSESYIFKTDQANNTVDLFSGSNQEMNNMQCPGRDQWSTHHDVPGSTTNLLTITRLKYSVNQQVLKYNDSDCSVPPQSFNVNLSLLCLVQAEYDEKNPQ